MLVKACIFDIFGTTVDWRTSVSRDLATFAGQKGIARIDWTEFADAWRKPRLDLQGTLGGETAITGQRRYFNTADVRVVSNWTGFDGGAAEAGAQAAREQMQAALDTLDSTRRDLGVEVARHWNAIATRQERIASWDKLVAQLT